MQIARAIAAVVLGYVVYALGSMLLVGFVMSGGGAVTLVVGLIALAVIGAFAGLLAAMIAGEKARIATLIAAGLVALATIANLALQLGAEPTWYKLGTLLLTVPAIVLIGRRRSSRA